MKLYFALTKEDLENGYIDYPKSKKYTHKGIHVTLQSLKLFIQENFRNYKDFYYIVLNKIPIDSSVDEHDNMVAIKLPLYFSLKNRKIRRLFK